MVSDVSILNSGKGLNEKQQKQLFRDNLLAPIRDLADAFSPDPSPSYWRCLASTYTLSLSIVERAASSHLVEDCVSILFDTARTSLLDHVWTELPQVEDIKQAE